MLFSCGVFLHRSGWTLGWFPHDSPSSSLPSHTLFKILLFGTFRSKAACNHFTATPSSSSLQFLVTPSHIPGEADVDAQLPSCTPSQHQLERFFCSGKHLKEAGLLIDSFNNSKKWKSGPNGHANILHKISSLKFFFHFKFSPTQNRDGSQSS